MDVASVRLNKKETSFLERMVSEGKFNSISQVLKAGLRKLMIEEKELGLPWKSREEVRKHFAQKKKKSKGLEDIHDEE